MSAPRLLIDENLSVRLPGVAHEAGFDAAHVNHRGLRTRKDWTLLETIREGDGTLVTNDAMEFKRRYAREAAHAGLIMLVPNVRRARQIELFSAALAEVARDTELTNGVIEADYHDGTSSPAATNGRREVPLKPAENLNAWARFAGLRRAGRIAPLTRR